MISKHIIVLSLIFIIGCQSSQPTIVLSFDVEYPHGFQFPDHFTEYQKLAFTPTEIQWENTLNRINEIGTKHNVRFQFNVVGMTGEDHPKLLKTLSESHDISCHGYSHKSQFGLTYGEKLKELKWCKERLETIIGREIKGNRFPYTSYTDDSFKALKEAGYEWDSSVWQDKGALFPSRFKGAKEYPIAKINTDWMYFLNQSKSDPKGFFTPINKDISSSKDEVYIIVLHPWILAANQGVLDELDKFVAQNKNSIKSIDQIHQKA